MKLTQWVKAKLPCEIVLYAAASAAALVVDATLLFLLVSLAGRQYLPSAAASFVSGSIFLYVLSVRKVFKFRRIRIPALELPVFVALGLAGLLVNLLVMWVLIESLHVHYLMAKAGASMCTFTTNYLLRRNLMFSRISITGAAR